MATQISVPFMIPAIQNHFQAVIAEHPTMKMGGVICNVGNELNKRFQLCGQIVARLEKDGWTVKGFGDGCRAQHPDIATEAQADLRLKAIGIDPKNVIVSSTWDDWFDFVLELPPLEEGVEESVPQYA